MIATSCLLQEIEPSRCVYIYIPYFTGYKSRLSCSKPALYTMGATYTLDATYTGYESCDELDYEY